MSEISNRIHQLIIEKDLSYSYLSKISGISKSALQRYATGRTPKIPLHCIELLASALGVSAAYLMGWEDREPATETAAGQPRTELDKLRAGMGLLQTVTFTAKDRKKAQLIEYYEQLNTSGRDEAVKRTEELTHIPKYTDKENSTDDE